MSGKAGPDAARRPFWLAELKAPEATAFLAPPLVAWRRLMAGLIVIGLAHTLLDLHLRGLTEFFFYFQDLPVAGLMLLLLSGLYLVRPNWAPAWSLAPTWRTAALIALAVTAFAWAGTYVVYDNYALSLDEFMARFDAQILASGRLAAPVPPEWRDYVRALQPQFVVYTAGNAFWYSGYLPVNAAFLALASRLGAESLMPPLWAGISILATFGVGRRLWPEAPRTALIAALLLATTPQLLITAMTPYAMSAHLALNMVWLWLVLRGGKAGHAGAALVAFLATGLHQIVFAPLFAAPFVLELWLAKRWKPAAWHTAAFAAIGLFWMLYQPMLMHFLGGSAVTEAAKHQGVLALLLHQLAAFDPSAVGYLAKNLIRFITWQNLLLTPLLALALAPAVRAGGVLRALVLGALATLAAVFVVMPYQGHGWGFRYLHGFLGSFSLLAAWSWMRVNEGAEPAARRAVFACGLAVSMLALLPLRAAQAHAFEHPYAMAVRNIQATDADVVVVADEGLWFGADLVRNRPDIGNRPIVLHAATLTPAQTQALCVRKAVIWLPPDDAARVGVRSVRRGKSERHAASPCVRADPGR